MEGADSNIRGGNPLIKAVGLPPAHIPDNL